MVDKQEIGRRLRSLRGSRLQTEVANAIGISPSALGMYEIGERIPRDLIKVKLAQYYGVDVGDLFYAQEYHLE